MDHPQETTHGKTSLWQMIKFTLFSISAGAIQIGSFTLFLEAFHWDYWVAYLISLILSVLWNYVLNRRYTFRSTENIARSMLMIFGFYAIFTPASTWLGNKATGAGWNEYLVLGISMITNFVLEFIYQRFVMYDKTIDTNDVAKRAREKEAAKRKAHEE